MPLVGAVPVGVVGYTTGVSKRLQVVVDETELERFQGAAEKVGMTLAEWVRQVLRRAERDSSPGDVEKKLAAVRAATRNSFPAPDIEEMLDQIERGYEQTSAG